MSNTAKRFAVILVGAFALSANAEEKLTAVEKYRNSTQYSGVGCGIELKTAKTKAAITYRTNTETAADEERAAFSQLLTCKHEELLKAKANFASAIRTVKSPAAKEALKTYHVAVIASLDGIGEGSKSRQEMLDGKAKEAWTRFEIEQ